MYGSYYIYFPTYIFYHSECIHVKVFFGQNAFRGKKYQNAYFEYLHSFLMFLIHRWINMLLSFFLPGELMNAFLLSLTGNGSIIPPIYPVYVEFIWELIWLTDPLTADSLECLNASRFFITCVGSTLYQNSKHIFSEMKLCGLVLHFYIHVSVSDLYIPADRSCEYMNRSQIHECGNWETEHYNSVLKIMWPWEVSFLGIHKSEPDTYIGFS